MAEKIAVSDEAFAYLKLQKGGLDKLSNDRAAWEDAYNRDLLSTFNEIRPHLPADCWGLLDVGSGLGGIDVLISRHYEARGRAPYVNLLDGEADEPFVHLHRQTFNDMQIAKRFQVENGVKGEKFAYYTPQAHNLPKPYDLVVSFGSWCFHYEPALYLPLLLSGGGLHMDTVVIVDLRASKPAWEAQLDEHFERVATIRRARKYARIVLKRKQ